MRSLQFPIWFLFLLFGSYHGAENSLPNQILHSLNKLLDYVESDYEDLNVDGLFSLRMAQGFILQAVEDVRKKGIHLDPSLRQGIEDTVRRMNRLLGAAYDYQHIHGSKYDKSFDQVVVRPLNRVLSYRHINNVLPSVSYVDLVLNFFRYNEDAGDACYKMVLGSGKYTDKPCNVTKKCVDYFMVKDRSGYGITHAVLYYYMAKVHGCERNIQAFLKRPLTSILKEFCTTSFAETKELAKRRTFRDLFMETITICGGLVGFEEFYRKDWWQMVHSLQSDDGCFQETAVTCKMRDKHRGHRAKTWHSRKLLRDRPMKDGCTSHITGMGGSVMGAYLAYLMEHGGRLFTM